MANKESVACFDWLRPLICHILAGFRRHGHRRRRSQRPCQNGPQWHRNRNSSGSYNSIHPNRFYKAKVRPYTIYGLTLAQQNAIVDSRWSSPFRRPTRGSRYATIPTYTYPCVAKSILRLVRASVCSFDYFDGQNQLHKSGQIYAALCVELYVLYTKL